MWTFIRLACSALLVSAVAGQCPPEPGIKLADGCRHVYIDMGTNIGHQIRKVYQPELYLGNPTEAIFKAYFPDDRSNVCSFGFEGNPLHDSRLKRLEKSFKLWGKRVRIYASTAVSTKYENVTFYQDVETSGHNQWTSGITTDQIAHPEQAGKVTVPAIDMACWLKNEVHNRVVPPGSLPPAIVLKTDIEGMDMQVLSHMLAEGSLCDIDYIYGEHMAEEWLSTMTSILQLANCTTKFQFLDDESGDDSLPLPVSLDD